MSYAVNEIFYSIQGEGLRAGTANVFVRFQGCNLRCSADDEYAGFECDSEFVSGRIYDTARDLVDAMLVPKRGAVPAACVLTGGEPALQLDTELLEELQARRWYVAVETNGTCELPTPDLIDWICVSPKTAFHTLKQKRADEFKLVRHAGQELPAREAIPVLGRLRRDAEPISSENPPRKLHLLVSPAFDPDGRVSRETLEWCIELVKQNPRWRLSCQQHKSCGIR
jgi:organic radical activating enzyme